MPPRSLFELPLDALQLGGAEGHEQPSGAASSAHQAGAAAGPGSPSADPLADSSTAAEAGGAAPPASEAAAGTCNTCGATWDSPPEWRQHFCSDWHRFNLKRRTAGLPGVSEQEWEALVDRDDVGSISGSESDSSEPEEDKPGTRAPGKQPHFLFGSPGSQLAVWRALVAPDREALAAAGGEPRSADDCLAALRRVRAQGGTFAVILLRGGHFVVAAFSLQPERVANASLSEKERFRVVAHKSAHRYVVRAGQGGKQTAKDATGKYARSAGSRLRR